MRLYRKERKRLFVLTAVVVLLGLLVVGCKDPTNSDDPEVPTTKSFQIDGSTYTATKSVSVPSLSTSCDRDVKFDGNEISLRNPPIATITGLRIIDNEGWGWNLENSSVSVSGVVRGLSAPIAVYGKTGSVWYDANLGFHTADDIRSFTFNGPRTANKGFTLPSTPVSVSQTDVKFNGTTVTIRAEVSDLIIIDGDGYGWRLNASTSSDGAIGGLVPTIHVYAKNASNQWYEATGDYITPSDPNPPNNFMTSPTSLGLPSGSYTAGTLIAAMNTRWDNAQTGSGTLFYPVSSTPSGSATVDGVSSLPYAPIYGASPEMIFLIKGSNLTVWGRNYGYSSPVTISFDIAIIRNSDGLGWLNQGLSGTQTESYAYQTEHPKTYTLSNLTGGAVTIASGLGSDYSVYIIVRDTSQLSAGYGPNFNTSGLKNENVIKPEIR